MAHSHKVSLIVAGGDVHQLKPCVMSDTVSPPINKFSQQYGSTYTSRMDAFDFPSIEIMTQHRMSPENCCIPQSVGVQGSHARW